jgi:O-antigen/teichoic acid export membrane protein
LALKLNVGLVAILSVPLILFGKEVIDLWIGPTLDQRITFIFPVIVCSFALLGMNVTARYVLIAAGKIKLRSIFKFYS